MTTSVDPYQQSEAGQSPAGVWLRRWVAAVLLVVGDLAVFGGASAVLIFGFVVFWPWVWERRNGRRLLVTPLSARIRVWSARILLAASALLLAGCALHLFGEASSRWLVRGPSALALAAVAAWVLRRT